MILPYRAGIGLRMAETTAESRKSNARRGRTLVAALLAIAGFAAMALPARAGQCESCRIWDVEQLGPYASDELAVRAGPDFSDDIKGKPRKIPLPGVGQATIRLKPGAGVWLGSAGEHMGEVFAAPLKGGAKAQWRFGF